MINIVIGEAALETVPEEIADHPAVKKPAERRGKNPIGTLLDISYHYTAMKKLNNWDSRGRPDITFISLLNLLESPLNKEGRVRVYVHTLNNYALFIDPEINLPRNYSRFQGLMEQLFETGRVPPNGRPLITLGRGTLKDLIAKIGPSRTFFMTEKGRITRGEEFGCKIVREERPAIVIGGFQKGEFSREELGLADERVSLYKDPLDAWIIASMVAQEAARALSIV
jgi:rRNA small subunit pseudouridine methyltransferase Nep1